MLKIIFSVIIFIWLFIGFVGIALEDDSHPNFMMIIFMGFALFIPFIAEACGIIPR
jgi:hypothetical protein